MAKKVTLKDYTGNECYPKTHVKQVLTEDGGNLGDELLNKVDISSLDFDIAIIGKMVKATSPCCFIVTKRDKNIGTLECLSDEANHMMTQKFTTHYLLPFSNNSHQDDKIFTYFRSYHIVGGTSDIPRGTWGEWQLIYSSDNQKYIDAFKASLQEISTAVSNLNANTGIDEYEEFSDQKEYKAGTTVLKDGLLKTFIKDHAAGAWDESEVESGSLKKDVENIIYKQFRQGAITEFNSEPNNYNKVIVSQILQLSNVILKVPTGYLIYVYLSNDSINIDKTLSWSNVQELTNEYKYQRIAIKKEDESDLTPKDAINLIFTSKDFNLANEVTEINDKLHDTTSFVQDNMYISSDFGEKVNGFSAFDKKSNTAHLNARIGIIVPIYYKNCQFHIKYNATADLSSKGLLYCQQKSVGNLCEPIKLNFIRKDSSFIFETDVILKTIPTDDFYIFIQISRVVALATLTINSVVPNKKVSVKENVVNLKVNVESLNRKIERNITIISVKKDGTGDYTSIQDAINSISDASANNRYEIDVYDDWIVNNISDLYLVNSPTEHSPQQPRSMSALVTTKNYVDIVGKGYGRRKLIVKSPLDIQGDSLQYIQTIYLRGNCKIKDFDVEIYGGRYAIHQESGGSKTSEDYHATTILENLNIIHHGNDDYTNGSSWTACCAQANGTTSGLNLYYYNCKWVSPMGTPFYCHTNSNFDAPNLFYFENCQIIHSKQVNIDDDGCGIRDLGSGQIHKIVLKGCNFTKFGTQYLNGGNLAERAFKNVLGYMPIVGYGNNLLLNNIVSSNGLIIKSKNENEQIIITGGNAVDELLGKYRTFNADFKSKSIIIGNIMIDGNGCYSLHEILGDCSSTNKNISINCGTKDITVTFNKDYTSLNDTAIISELNSTYQDLSFNIGINESYVNKSDVIEIILPNDCIEECYNNSDEAFKPFQCVVRDFVNGINTWRLANSGEIADGIVSNRIDPLNYGNIILANKAIFGKQYVLNLNANNGDYIGVGEDSYPVKLNDSTNAIWKMIDKYHFIHI